ncbi:Tryptophan synthase beta chain 2 [Candidatus Burarchaeum australiense]|nr:Tryptophan synthase beta chain 2 [Candidatus Burarchaeum australiense]
MSEEEIPKQYYNILPDLPRPLDPYLGPDGAPVKPEQLEAIFPKELIRQEMSGERFVAIPEEVRGLLARVGRPTPLQRAVGLEKRRGTPARIYYKNEGSLFTGAHKINTAIAQAYYNAREGTERLATHQGKGAKDKSGKRRLSTETGAMQWGTALALACSLFELECEVFAVADSFNSKPGRRTLIELFGAKLHSSPSPVTEAGRRALAQNRNHPGSLGIAISEAIELAVSDERTKYSLGSVLNHVLLHQTVIGQEVIEQLKLFDEREPDYFIGCFGGGSNFAGFAYPALGLKLQRKAFRESEFRAVEPAEVPSLTAGEYRYDHGDTAGYTPKMKMYSLGKDTVPARIMAAGLRYHGAAPSASLLVNEGKVKAIARPEAEVFEAMRLFSLSEGLVPAPESSHAIADAVALALEAKRKNEERVIVFNLSGHGFLDLQSYQEKLEAAR